MCVTEEKAPCLTMVSIDAAGVEDKFGVSFQKHAESRKHMTGPSMGIHPLANPWLKGTGLQSELREVDIKENPSASK